MLVILTTGCSTKITRPEIQGFVFDRMTKLPVNGAEISVEVNGGNKTNESKTDQNGEFNLKKITQRKLFDFESGHDPNNYYFKVQHPNYVDLEISGETRGSFSEEVTLYDTIYIM